LEEHNIGKELELKCTNCGKAVGYKKELNKEGHCYRCSKSIVDSCKNAIGDFETNICLHYLNTWLLKLKKGKTAMKYADKQVASIPKSFYKQWKEACGA
jgi:hypothetical protein